MQKHSTSFRNPSRKHIPYEWKYIFLEREDVPEKEPLFIGVRGNRITRNAIYKLIRRIGESADVRGAHPHKFRHTFAVMFLRNGGNVYALQKILEHTTLEMVKEYLALAQADVDQAHRTALSRRKSQSKSSLTLDLNTRPPTTHVILDKRSLHYIALSGSDITKRHITIHCKISQLLYLHFPVDVPSHYAVPL